MVPALRNLKQEGHHEFKYNFSYVRLHLKKHTKIVVLNCFRIMLRLAVFRIDTVFVSEHATVEAHP